MPADWAAQRIKNLDLRKAVINAILPKRNQTEITTLIEEFQYPKYGPGMMWEVCAEKVQAAGGTVHLYSRVTAIKVADGRAHSVAYQHRPDGSDVTEPATEREIAASHVISTMPMRELVHTLSPPPPPEVLAAADGLHYRDYLTVALVVPEPRAASPTTGSTSTPPRSRWGGSRTTAPGRPTWSRTGTPASGSSTSSSRATRCGRWPTTTSSPWPPRSWASSAWSSRATSRRATWCGCPRPTRTTTSRYKANVETIRSYLEAEAPNVHPVGRNGMHKYNNQDHSMYTAMLTVENIFGASHDIWAVNVEEEYHEGGSRGGGTGRDAPILPPRATVRRRFVGHGRDPSATMGGHRRGRGVLPRVGLRPVGACLGRRRRHPHPLRVR